jgi:hypothetical protein
MSVLMQALTYEKSYNLTELGFDLMWGSKTTFMDPKYANIVWTV